MCSADAAVAQHIHHPAPNQFCTEHLNRHRCLVLNKKNKTIEDNKRKNNKTHNISREMIVHRWITLVYNSSGIIERALSGSFQTGHKLQMLFCSYVICAVTSISCPCLFHSLPPTVFGSSSPAARVFSKARQPWSPARDSGYGTGKAAGKLPCSQVTVVWKPTWDHWVNKWF